MNANPTLIQEEAATPADAKISQVIEKIVADYGNDLSVYVAAVRRRNPLPPPDARTPRFNVSEHRQMRLRARS